jgi:hypothetical protein
VEFTLHPPQPRNDDPTQAYLRATLWIGRMTRPWKHGRVTLSLRHAFLAIPATSFQPAEFSLIGDTENPHEHFVRVPGGTRITGPIVGAFLEGEVLLGSHLAVIEPGAADGRALTVTIQADQDCFDVAASRAGASTGDTKPPGINKHLVLKQLIFDACDKTEDGSAILARRRLQRRVAP